jgi:hypothetical protein
VSAAEDRVTGYGSFYAAAGTVAFVPSFLPPYEDRHIGGFNTTYVNVWEDLPDGASVPAGVLIVVLLLLAFVINLRPPANPLAPAAVAVLGLLGLLLIIARPGTGSPEPDLATGGLGLLGVTILVLATGVGHAIHLAVVRYSRRR